MDYKNQPTPPPYYGGGANYGARVATQVNTVMRKVYTRMFFGLLVSAFCALGVASSPALISLIYGNSLVYILMVVAMFAMAIMIPVRLTKMKQGTVLLLFLLFAALMGASLSSIFIVYKLGSIISTFFITAGTFGAMSVYGYFTKTDLSKIGSYLIMALFGLILLSIVNIFLHSGPMEWIITIIGLLVFIGLTAWDTQQVRRLSEANLDPGLADRLATMGAMNLYLDFINLFLFLLRIFGGRNN